MFYCQLNERVQRPPLNLEEKNDFQGPTDTQDVYDGWWEEEKKSNYYVLLAGKTCTFFFSLYAEFM